MVDTFRQEMTLKAAEAIKMALDEGAVCRAKRAYHVHPDTADTWHYAFLGEGGMEGIALLPKCAQQGNDVSAIAKVAVEWIHEAGKIGEWGEETGTWTVAAIRRARYRRGEWTTREETKQIFPMVQKGPVAQQWRGQAVHILMPHD